MLDVAKAVERLNEIREVKKALEEEERALREALQNLVRASGGRLVVSGYVLTLNTVETFQYGKIVSLLRARHPELESELSELSERFKTVYTRLNIEQS